MPDDNKNNQNGGTPNPAENGNGDGGNNGGAPAGGQPNGGQQPAEDETITIKKADYDKQMSDLENYRQATIGDKYRPLPDNPNPNGGGSGGAAPGNDAGGGGSTITEDKVKEIATQVSSQNTQKKNEKDAKDKFYAAHPEYVDTNAWQALVVHYVPKSGKDSVEDILNDLEDAVLAHKRRTGKLDEYFDQQRIEAERKAQIDAQVNLGQNGGGVGDRSSSGGGQPSPVTDSTIQMGSNFGHTKEDLEKGLGAISKGSEGYELDISKKSKK